MEGGGSWRSSFYTQSLVPERGPVWGAFQKVLPEEVGTLQAVHLVSVVVRVNQDSAACPALAHLLGLQSGVRFGLHGGLIPLAH